jgi:hypothetical protein
LTRSLGEKHIEVSFADEYTRDSSSDFDLFLTFPQGYVAVHKRPVAENYVAIDLVLWDDIDYVNAIKTALISSLGGDEQKSSSYRLVIGGIKGSNRQPFLVSSARELGTCDNPEGKIQETDESIVSASGIMIQLLPETANSILVVCGSRSDTCPTLEALKTSSINALGLFECDGVAKASTKNSDLVQCEIEVMQTIRAYMANKINAILLDENASKSTTQVLLRLLVSLPGREEVLSDKYVVMAQLTSEAWRERFVQRFLTEFSPFLPSSQARLSCSGAGTILFFSAGDQKFYDNLIAALTKLQSQGQKITLDNVIGGHPSYTPNFSPKFFNNKSFDNTRAFEQWNSQTSIAIQTILQLELKAPKAPLKKGQEVLLLEHDHIRFGTWINAKVVNENDDMTYFVITDRSGDYIPSVPRDALRPLDFDVTASPLPTIDIGARVLFKVENHWEQGFVVSRFADDRKYEIRTNSGDGAVVVRDVEDVLPHDEKTHEEQLPLLSMSLVEKVFRKALTIIANEISIEFSQQSHGIGDGCVLTAAWTRGTAVVVWDGESHIDINLLMDEEEDSWIEVFHSEFLKRIPFLASVRRDEQPRGFGGVVNFSSEIRQGVNPIWWPKSDDNYEDEDNEDHDDEDVEDEEYDEGE